MLGNSLGWIEAQYKVCRTYKNDTDTPIQQGRNSDANADNGHMHTVGLGVWGSTGRLGLDTYIYVITHHV